MALAGCLSSCHADPMKMSFCLKYRSIEEIGASGMPQCIIALARRDESG
jgi:hypothetical protein